MKNALRELVEAKHALNEQMDRIVVLVICVNGLLGLLIATIAIRGSF